LKTNNLKPMERRKRLKSIRRSQRESFNANINRSPYCLLEMKYLKHFYSDVSNLVLAEQLGRSYRSICTQAFKMGLVKSKQYKETERAKTYFPKGHVPANKGTKGIMKRNSGTFKKGNIPATAKYDGCVTVRTETMKNGKPRPYKYVRLDKAKWQPLHHKIWIEEHGPIPAGHIIIFRDGNSLNCIPENLQMITKRENADRNRNYYNKEIRLAVRLINKIKKKIYEKHRTVRSSGDNV
jgi:HNH endonuclease